MARGATRQVSSEEVGAADDETMAQPLHFDEPLTWRAGKPIPVADLLRRLKALSEELEGISQENADRDSLAPKAQELAHTQLLDHRDKGVRAYAMMSIVEMIRLLAPDAPYKGGQLKQIFTIFVSSMIPALANPSDPYNQLHSKILASLHEVKSIVLLADIHGSDVLILNLFTNCFDVMSGDAKGSSGETLPKNVELRMTGLLCTLIDETEGLPSGVIEVILAQFLRADPNAILSGSKKDVQLSEVLTEPSPAYNMARAICNTCADRIVHVIAHYFSSILVDATQAIEGSATAKSKGKKRTRDDSEDESDDGISNVPGEDDLKEAEKAHRLLRELWRATPDITRNVIPQLEAELRTENVHLRELAVQTVGDMVAGIGAAGPPPPVVMNPSAYPSQSLEPDTAQRPQKNILLTPSAPVAFSAAYAATYQALVDRHKDKAWQVRSAFATAAGRILLTSAGGKGLGSDQEAQLMRYLSDLLVDMDDRVRLAAVEVIATFDYHSIMKKLGSNGNAATPGSILHGLADRVKDRKHPVRVAAMLLLGRLWGVASGAIAERSERTRDLVGTIPSKILDAMYLNDPQVNALVGRVMWTLMLPVAFPPLKAKSTSTSDDLPDPDAIRAERILVFVQDLEEERAKKVFFAMQQRQPEIAKYTEAYLKACEAFNGGSNSKDEKAAKKQLDGLISYLAQKFAPDPEEAADHLRKFAKHHDRRCYQLIRFCYSPESDYRKIVKAMKELLKRLDDAPDSITPVQNTLIPIVRMASILIYNKSHVPAIVEFSRTDAGDIGKAAHTLLKEISTKAPDIFKIHVKELCETLKQQSPDSAVAEKDKSIVDTLKACAGFARRFPGGMPKDRDFYRAMIAFASRGSPPKAAKHAVTVILSSADKREMYIKQIEDACIEDFKYGEPDFIAKLAAISQLRLLARNESDARSDQILTIAIDEVLSQMRTKPQASDPDWTDTPDNDLSAKLWALKILVNGLRGLHPIPETEEARTQLVSLAKRVYQLLNVLIQHDGELDTKESAATPKHQKAHLRLNAAIQLLKLSCIRPCDQLFAPADFNRLSKLAQDPTPEVRAQFLAALKKRLGTGALPNRFYAFIFLYAFEPDRETRDAAVAWLKARAATHARAEDTVMEATFARFLSLLAHHPDFSVAPEDLRDFVEYILFYLKTVATQANLPLIYHIAQRLKSVQDGIAPAKSRNLYIISDLAEAIIRQFQDIQGWSLQIFSGKVGLPNGIFTRLPGHDSAQEIADKRYLPQEFAEELEDIVKDLMKSKKRKSDGTSGQTSKKAKSTSSGHAKKPASGKRTSKAAKATRTPKRKSDDGIPSSELRKSSRVADARNYAEGDSSEDDEMMQEWQEDSDEEADKENHNTRETSSSSSMSDPPPSSPKLVEKQTAKPARGKGKKIDAPAAAAVKPVRSARVASRRQRDVMDVPSDSA